MNQILIKNLKIIEILIKKIRKEIINNLKKELSDKHRDSVRIKRTIQWIINVFRGKNEAY